MMRHKRYIDRLTKHNVSSHSTVSPLYMLDLQYKQLLYAVDRSETSSFLRGGQQ